MNKKKNPENPNEIVGIDEKIIEFNRQQRGQGLKKLTPSQMLTDFFSSIKSRK